MTITRRRGLTVDRVLAPTPTNPSVRPPTPGVGVPLPVRDAPAPETVTPVGRLRRCTFRRIDPVSALPDRPSLPTYEVMCLYDDREEPLALGDVDAAQPICETCTAVGIFRPDED